MQKYRLLFFLVIRKENYATFGSADFAKAVMLKEISVVVRPPLPPCSSSLFNSCLPAAQIVSPKMNECLLEM